MLREYMEEKEDDWIDFNGGKVHKTAVIAPWVRFEDNCIVHPYAVVGRIPSESAALARQPGRVPYMVTIGIASIIGCHAVVYNDVVLGDRCLVGDFALIREGSRIGEESMIGCHVSISYNSRIGKRSRFQNGSVFHGTCGDDCFFGVGVVCSSDKRIDLNNYQHLGSHPPIFGNRVLVGSGSNILPEITIGDDAVIGAGSVVVKDVKPQSLVLGPIAKETIPHYQV